MKKILAISVFAASVMAPQAFATPITFTGDIVDTPCVISTGDAGGVDVIMGEVKASTFTAAGDKSIVRPFQITLEECDLTTGKTKVSTTFRGMADSTNQSLLSVATVSGSAENVGLEISDSTGTPIPVNTAGNETVMTTGQNILNFGARYVATAANVTTGHANATADFTFTYQ
jgi:major type 1 subunit fimbrin (pilin)